MIFQEIRSPPPAPIAYKKRRLSYRGLAEVRMPDGIFMPFLDEETPDDSNGMLSFLQPRFEDSSFEDSSNQFHLSPLPSKHQDYNAANSLPGPVATIEDEDGLKNDLKRPRPLQVSTTIHLKRTLLHELEVHACCA
jgi:hypothetical protein